MKVNTLDEGAIRDIGHAFGYYDYGAERGLIDLFPGRDAVASYICGYVRMALLGGTLRPGIETLLDLAGFDRLLERADLVITGEGRLDGQSLRGKVISGVARRAKGRVPVIAIVGGIADDAVPAYGLGVVAMFSIDRAALPFSESAPRSAADYRATLRDVLRVWQLGRVGHSH